MKYIFLLCLLVCGVYASNAVQEKVYDCNNIPGGPKSNLFVKAASGVVECRCQQLLGGCKRNYAPVCDVTGESYSNFCTFCHTVGKNLANGTPPPVYKGSQENEEC
uniref:Uncharacterized LOC100179753 n=1 Tax=Ciona intestinalis TaxID=7719 RepID=H2Y1G4_CIOIN|nr:uncharacterized protein LOC100179753 [Ciona intestinalis]|eukprot:XP_026693983.1 uncharacterized protein LOC100179753 [Ciona intestinalis]